ncbi:hypothetical protein [Luteolibacter soli]|uniref:Uncharacterized protein n=1 Tax=Luteolibacter soli TaxID=3135280 RepID=A0ABU9ATE8_9BACT
MKPLHLLPPAVAIAASGIWLGLQQQSISTLEKETVLLRKHVDAAKQAAAGDHSSLAAARADGKKGKDPDAINWKDLADTMAKAEHGGMPDMRAMMKLQSKLMSLSGDELKAALDEIAALDLSKDARNSLENMLINLLAQKDPKLVLDRYLDRMNDSRNGFSGWQMANAFQQWARKDGAAAVAWLDAQVAAGKFESKSLDGKNDSRLKFESAAIAALLNSDVDAAGKRLSALPEDQRRELFEQGMFSNLKPGTEKNLAALVRSQVPEKEQPQALANSTGMLVHQGGYERVGKFLDEIDATPAERNEVVKRAASSQLQQLAQQGKVDREAVDKMREWAAQESSPESVDKITGESLGNIWNRDSKWQDSAKIVSDLYAEKPSDDLLISFLSGHQSSQASNKEAAVALAAKISDETKRAEVIANIQGREIHTSTTTSATIITE